MAKYMEAIDLALDAATATHIEPPEVIKTKEYPTERNGFKSSVYNGDAVLIKNFKLDESILPVPPTQGPYVVATADGKPPSLEERAVAGKKRHSKNQRHNEEAEKSSCYLHDIAHKTALMLLPRLL